jgi:DNA-binding response OmpR family regulator
VKPVEGIRRNGSTGLEDRPEDEPRQRPLVMMVEDDPDDRQIYGTILCYNGFDVVLVPNGSGALRSLDLYHPDLIVLDLGLPDASGIEVCRELSREVPGVPVIALSGFSRNMMGERAQDAGFISYIEKPTNPLHVLHQIEEILGRPPSPGDGAPPRLIPLY